MVAVYVDSLSPDIDPAKVAAALAQALGLTHGAAPRTRWLPLATSVAQIAESEDPLGHRHELAVVAHLAAMVAHTFQGNAHVQDTSPLLVMAFIDTERQNVCGFSRSADFVKQLDVLASALQQNASATHILVAGEAEESSPDYEAYIRRASEKGVQVITIDPDGKGCKEVVAEATRATGLSGALLRDYM